ncbi:MAG: biosynthetic peptidoglycan transglycosylase [Bdellovibrionota bacterium]
MNLYGRQTYLMGFVSAILVLLLTSGCLMRDLPDVGMLNGHYPVIQHRGRDLPFKVKLQKQIPSGWTRLSDISKFAIGAVVVSEDWAFYQHNGFDMNQIKEAAKEDLAKGRFVRGASTITQQVVRNIFLDKDKNIWRKLREIWLAMQLEKKLSKSRILEIYFNIAEWGDGLFGIGDASRRYFNKEPRDLTAKEGAFLAMLLPSPRRYSQSFRNGQLTAYARETTESVLKKMVQAHYLTEDEMVAELGSTLSFEKTIK